MCDLPYFHKLTNIYHDPFSNKSVSDSIESQVEDISSICITDNKTNELNFPNSKETQYEDIQLLFNEYFNSSPDKIVRVPYVIELLGDCITNLLDKKLLTTLTDDIIIFGRKNKNSTSQIEFYDLPKSNIQFDTNCLLNNTYNNVLEEKENLYPYLFYSLMGMKDAIDNSNLLNSEKSNIEGFDILISLGPYFLDKKQSFINCYICSFILGLSLYFQDIKNNLSNSTMFNIIYSNLIKLNIYDKDEFSLFKSIINEKWLYFHLYSIMYLEKNELLLISYDDKQPKKVKLNENITVLTIESFSTEPPLFYKIINYWNKRLLEIRLGLALIIQKLLKDKDTTVYSYQLENKYSDEDVIVNLSNIRDFFLLFNKDYNYIEHLINNYLKQDSYYTTDIRSQINNNIFNKLTSEFEYIDNILISNKGFELHNRLKFIINESKRLDNVNVLIDNHEDKNKGAYVTINE